MSKLASCCGEFRCLSTHGVRIRVTPTSALLTNHCHFSSLSKHEANKRNLRLSVHVHEHLSACRQSFATLTKAQREHFQQTFGGSFRQRGFTPQTLAQVNPSRDSAPSFRGATRLVQSPASEHRFCTYDTSAGLPGPNASTTSCWKERERQQKRAERSEDDAFS